MGVVQSFAGLPNVSLEAAKKQKAEKAGCTSSWGQSGDKEVVHVGPDTFTNSCDAIRRIVDCTLEQIVSPYQRVVCAAV